MSTMGESQAETSMIKRSGTSVGKSRQDIILEFKARMMWKDFAPKCAKRYAVITGFNEAVGHWHKLKRAFRKLEKIYIEWRDHELPRIKHEKEWQEE